MQLWCVVLVGCVVATVDPAAIDNSPNTIFVNASARVWVSPSTNRVPQNATAPSGAVNDGWDYSAVELDAAKGETESATINIRVTQLKNAYRRLNSLANATAIVINVSVTPFVATSHSTPANTPSLRLGRVAAVPCAESKFYTLPPGFYPDAVVPALQPSTNLSSSVLTFPADMDLTHSVLLETIVASATEPGNYSASVTASVTNCLGGASIATVVIPVTLRVWPVTVPPLANATMPTIFNFPYSDNDDGATDIGAYYGHAGELSTNTKIEWFRSLCTARVPPDLPYTATPRSVADLQLLTNTTVCPGGVARMALLNVVRAANATSHAPQLSYSSEQLQSVVTQLSPLVTQVRANGWINRAYVYGFDEVSQDYTHAIQQLFGAVKMAFPDLRTVATLRWTPPTNASFPLDTWNNLYSLWDDAAAAAWKAARGNGNQDVHVKHALNSSVSSSAITLSRETWAYHCISPRPSTTYPHYDSGTGWLNTFVEYPLVSARLLMWWAATRNAGVDGWLYYLVDGWATDNNYEPLNVNTSSQVAFSAVRYNGKLKGFSNGDGILLYPGPDGHPAPSLRLLSFRDGLEDYELFRQLTETSGQATVIDAISAVVRSATNYSVDVAGEVTTALAIRSVRRWALAELSKKRVT